MTSREATGFLPLADLGDTAGLADRATVWAWALIQWPWLLRSLSGGRREDKARLLARLGLADDALPNLGSWKADCFFLHSIVDAIEEMRPRTVVELGCGASSLVAGRALELNGEGALTSFDQHGGFVEATRSWLEGHGVEADLRCAPLGEPPAPWPGRWYRLGVLPERIDLLIVDGPPWSEHPLVRGAADSLFERISVGGRVLLDDAARPGERVVVARWAKRWPDFRFERPRGGTKGLVVGTRLR